MTEILITAEMPMTGVNAGDKAVNNFVFHKEGAYVPGEATNLMDEVVDFYANGAGSISTYLAANLDRGVGMASLKAYNITGKLGNRGPDANGKEQGPPPHGSPIAAVGWTLAAPASTQDLPPQAAVVVTLRARNALSYPVEAADGSDEGFATDRPRSRRTGRIYLGPLNWAALAAGGADLLYGVKAAFRTSILNSCEGLSDGAAANGYGWVVWSRQNDATSVIERVEVDNSFDVIRRRKSAPTVRDIRTFAPVPDLALGA